MSNFVLKFKWKILILFEKVNINQLVCSEKGKIEISTNLYIEPSINYTSVTELKKKFNEKYYIFFLYWYCTGTKNPQYKSSTVQFSTSLGLGSI